MYESYEEKIKKYAALLRTAFIALACVVILIVLALGYIFGVGVKFGDLKCYTTVYGSEPEVSLSASVPTVFEYRRVGEKDAKFSANKPTRAGKYEVRVYTVSLIGIKKFAGSGEFEIRPAALKVSVPSKEDYKDVKEILIDPKECKVEGLKYGDRADDVVLEYFYASAQEGKATATSVKLTHSDGTDALDCYTINLGSGTVKDARSMLLVTPRSKKVVYDGDPNVIVTEEEYSVSGAFFGGHTAHFRCEGVQKGFGESPNVIAEDSRFITDQKGNDVTYMYLITCAEGKLEFARRQIVIKSDSDSKEYDGTPLTKHSGTVTKGSLADGDSFTAVYYGYIIDPGKVENDFDKVRITNRTYGDVTDCYEVEKKFGTLRITVNGVPGDVGTMYIAPDEDGFDMDMNSEPFQDMIPLKGDEYKDLPAVFEFYGIEYGRMYFREMTYGVYTGRGFRKVQGEEKFGNYGNYMLGQLLKEEGSVLKRSYIRNNKLLGGVYPYFMAKDREEAKEDSGFKYDYSYELYSLPLTGSYPVRLSDEEERYTDFVMENYLDVPDDVYEVLRELGSKAGISEDDEYIIDNIANYISNAAAYDLSFPTFPADEDMVVYFLTESKKGICQHFAAAATMMYRAYGIPARYVVGLASSSTPSRWNKAYPSDGHAWVEVYLAGTGWIPVEVTGSPAFDGFGGGGEVGTIDMVLDDLGFSGKPDIDVAFNYFEKEYDGNPVDGIEAGGTFISGTLEPDEAVVFNGETMSCPKYANEYQFYGEARVVNSAGVDVTDKYEIYVQSYPTINIKPRKIEITTYGMKGAEQDGRVESSGWYISKGMLASGDRIELTLDASQYDVGKTSNTPRYIHVYNEDNEDVTDCYNISVKSGMLQKE